MSQLPVPHHVGGVLLNKLFVVDVLLVSVVILHVYWGGHKYLVEDEKCIFSVFSWFYFELHMVFMSVSCPTYLGCSVVI